MDVGDQIPDVLVLVRIGTHRTRLAGIPGIPTETDMFTAELTNQAGRLDTRSSPASGFVLKRKSAAMSTSDGGHLAAEIDHGGGRIARPDSVKGKARHHVRTQSPCPFASPREPI